MSNLVKRLTQQKHHHSSPYGESLEELCRKATNKNLAAPDFGYIQSVVNMINDEQGRAEIPTRDIVAILRRRLQMENPHKQWLAIHLMQKVLSECSRRLATYQDELLQEIARVAAKPSKRGPGEAQRRARQAAAQLLSAYGPAGQHALRMVTGLSAVPGMDSSSSTYMNANAAAMPFGPTRSPTQTAPPSAQQPIAVGSAIAASGAVNRANVVSVTKQLIEAAHSNAELLVELASAAESNGGFQGQSAFVNELLQQTKELKQQFERTLGELSAAGGPEAESLMAQALEAVDALDNSMTLAEDIKNGVKKPVPPPAEQQAPADAENADSDDEEVATASQEPPPLPVIDLLGLDADDTPAAPAPPTAPVKAESMDPFGLSSLQVALDQPATAQSAPPQGSQPQQPRMQPVIDPFAAPPHGAFSPGALSPGAFSSSQPSPAGPTPFAQNNADPFAMHAQGSAPSPAGSMPPTGSNNPFGPTTSAFNAPVHGMMPQQPPFGSVPPPPFGAAPRPVAPLYGTPTNMVPPGGIPLPPPPPAQPLQKMGDPFESLVGSARGQKPDAPVSTQALKGGLAVGAAPQGAPPSAVNPFAVGDAQNANPFAANPFMAAPANANPFMAPTSAPSAAGNVDAEWNKFVANNNAGGPPQQQTNVDAEFSAFVGNMPPSAAQPSPRPQYPPPPTAGYYS